MFPPVEKDEDGDEDEHSQHANSPCDHGRLDSLDGPVNEHRAAEMQGLRHVSGMKAWQGVLGITASI
jgi:hypothetical protein